jgi:hypothetical protein
LAIGATAVELHPVMKSLKMVALGNSALKGFEGLVFKFDNLSTTEADQMIMVVSA